MIQKFWIHLKAVLDTLAQLAMEKGKMKEFPDRRAEKKVGETNEKLFFPFTISQKKGLERFFHHFSLWFFSLIQPHPLSTQPFFILMDLYWIYLLLWYILFNSEIWVEFCGNLLMNLCWWGKYSKLFHFSSTNFSSNEILRKRVRAFVSIVEKLLNNLKFSTNILSRSYLPKISLHYSLSFVCIFSHIIWSRFHSIKVSLRLVKENVGNLNSRKRQKELETFLRLFDLVFSSLFE